MPFSDSLVQMLARCVSTVRGLSTSLVVKPKHAAEYEVVPAPGGRDPSQGRGGSQGAAGQRVWNVFKF